jgi:dTMP kinase
MKIISFEGFEYSGKSTQIKLLKAYLKKNKIKATFTREPGGNAKQLEKIRKIIT